MSDGQFAWNTAEIDSILTLSELQALRGGYDGDWMNRAARATVAGSFHAALPLENLLIQTFSTAPFPTEIPPKDRERVLIAVLCTTSPTSFNLAVHFYWGLMVGMEPGEIAWTLLLTGFYSGISHFSSALVLLVKTLHVLKASASEKTQSEAVLAALTSALAS